MKNNIIVYVRGGLVQGVIAQNPDEVNVIIVDYDNEGQEELASVGSMALGTMEQLKENHKAEPDVLKEIMDERE